MLRFLGLLFTFGGSLAVLVGVKMFITSPRVDRYLENKIEDIVEDEEVTVEEDE